jgi:outer membrane receptor protein involved in Fe transport
VTSDTQALFGQGAWQISERLKVMLAARADWGSLYDFQFSPRGAITYDVAPNQSVRLTYSRAFQVPNSLEYFLDAFVAPPTDLSAFNAVCAPFGVNCRFGSTAVIAVGNEDLAVERVRTWEVGYKGVIQRRALLAVDYYKSQSSNLTTSLLPQLGTPLGRLNPNYGPWQGPAGLPDAVADVIRGLVPILSNRADGSNVLVAASYTNFDTVNIQGVDVALNYSLPAGWRIASSYSWFDFNVQDQPTGTEDLLLPNAPDHAFSAGLAYERGRIGASVDVRWVGDFRWADGFFLGDVKSYAVVEAAAIYPLTASVSVTANVSNLFNDQHWESFGGALLKRRALVGLQYNW